MSDTSSVDHWGSDEVPPPASSPMTGASGGGDERPKAISVLALVLATSPLFLSLILDVGIYIAIGAGVAAIALGVIGVARSNRLVSIIGIALAAVSTALSFAFPDEDVDATVAEAPDHSVITHSDVEPVIAGDFEFTVESVEHGAIQLGTEAPIKYAAGQFVIVDLTIENLGDFPGIFYDGLQKLVDTDGNEYTAESDAGLFLDGDTIRMGAINSGDTIEGKLLFDVPEGTELAAMRFQVSNDTEGVEVSLL
ncbi:DUF4352 domain-containing protein [Glycomyces salinus]|uniref:DUF4352 domain-containing protein n=1 Tax=Glycomyces salinus TaxID=980294 RepID=UPI0018ED668D|nr:DUF4352 domain-containing protein [Glycomyces salinus]